MSDTEQRIGPNESDHPSSSSEEANVFGYNVADQAANNPSEIKPSPNSPLAAG
jgi:hypothetical protein